MERTISTHNGSIVNREHNIRAYYVVAKENHIDTSLSSRNETIVDISLNQAYIELFDEARIEYNKQMVEKNHPERQIKNYLSKIRKDKKKHAAYEMIVQIGNRDDTGIDGEIERECIKEFIADWKNRNPNLKLIGAYIHADEINGTLHAHLDYIPVAHNCKTGMKTQTSLVRALGEQGFVGVSTKQTAQIAWEKRENNALEQICLNHGIAVVHPKTGEKHRDKKQFIAYQQELDVIKSDIAEKRKEVNKADEEVQNLKKELSENAEKLNESKELIEINANRVNRIKDINAIETKPAIFSRGKILVDSGDYQNVVVLAKKQIASESKERQLCETISSLKDAIAKGNEENERLRNRIAELGKFKQLYQNAVRELENLRRLHERVLQFVERQQLGERLREFLNVGRRGMKR